MCKRLAVNKDLWSANELLEAISEFCAVFVGLKGVADSDYHHPIFAALYTIATDGPESDLPVDRYSMTRNALRNFVTNTTKEITEGSKFER